MVREDLNIYEFVGGEATFHRLVEVFYAAVETDPLLRPMFPEDLAPGKQWQKLFLVQYFGGPAQYLLERGHPRLRMRHAPFPVDLAARDAWLNHMLNAIDQVGITEPARSIMREYFERGSAFMINKGEVPDTEDGQR